jgi:hypothetical protein
MGHVVANADRGHPDHALALDLAVTSRKCFSR